MISLILFFLIALSSDMGMSRSNEKSKFNVKLVTVAKCKEPPTKWDPASPIHTELSIMKISRDIINMNMTFNVSRTFGPVELLVRAYKVRENSVKDLLFKIEHADCRSHLAMTINNFMKFRYDNKCLLKAGVYGVTDFDFNNIKWLMKRSFTSRGRYYYEYEISHAEGATSCITIVCNVTV